MGVLLLASDHNILWCEMKMDKKLREFQIKDETHHKMQYARGVSFLIMIGGIDQILVSTDQPLPEMVVKAALTAFLSSLDIVVSTCIVITLELPKSSDFLVGA